MRVGVDTTITGRICEPEHPDGPVRFYGEFDVFVLPTLRGFLGGAQGCGHAVSVDLSGVTFLDVGCARELAVRALSPVGRLTLLRPSWQAGASLEACGIAGALATCRGRTPDRTEAREYSERKTSEIVRLAV